MATIDTLSFPDPRVEEETRNLRDRARQVLRLLHATELAAFQELGGADRLLVASDLGIHEFGYRPSSEDPSVPTVGHALTRWVNVKGVELAIRFARADSDRYVAHVSIREPNFQAGTTVTGDAPSAAVEFGSACLGQFERAAAH